MAGPTSRHTARYHPGNAPSEPDGRLYSDVFPRNAPPIVAALAPHLAGRTGPVLEIGCGTGQHAAACQLAFPRLDWRASDPDPVHRASAEAWAAHLKTGAGAPLAVDASGDWADQEDVRALGALTAVVAMNVIHIAPVAVMDGILLGAGKALDPGGLLIFYGPFTVAGRFIGEGNKVFDRALRAEDPDWGLRDTDEVTLAGETWGLGFAALVAMPANNRLLVLRRD